MTRRGRRCISVYVAVAAPDLCKVGLSRDPWVRVWDLRSPQGGRVTIHAAFHIGWRADARSVELRSHMTLGASHVEREWFACSGDVAAEAVASAIRHLVLNGSIANPEPQPWLRMA